jgi:hypothetical protein
LKNFRKEEESKRPKEKRIKNIWTTNYINTKKNESAFVKKPGKFNKKKNPFPPLFLSSLLSKFSQFDLKIPP